ncbi:PilN domain-containing protein [Pelobacter seleniigenes]|uniref:PilN domain-containing protein n=1 Tax=Pelobacter seleniigenes TaxID=407188 RepID=UPI0004A6D169|nr:PilN domain-containing protein [Pelobacter seleniigenes]
MIRINLLPVRAAQKKERLRIQLSIFFLCILLVCIGCGALYVQKMTAINGVEADIANIDRQNKDLQKQIGQVKDYEQKKADLEKKLAVLKSLKAGKTGPVHLLDQLSASLPDNLWLTKFTEKGGRINLSGVADNEKTVAVFMRNLESSPYYKKVELSVTEQTKVGDDKMQKFSLDSDIEAPPSK